MKRLLTLVAFFATVQASAQQVNPVPDYVFRNQMSVGRGTVTDTAAYFSIGPRYGANKGFMPPIVVDTATFSSGKRNGLLIFSVQKNKFLYWDSVRVQWSDMAGGSGSYITGSGIAGYLPQFSASTTLDTSALFTLGNRLGIGTSTFAYNSTNTANMELNGTAGGIIGFKRNDSARGYLWHTGDNMELANTAAGSISFNTNSATRGSISSAGVWRLHNLAGTGDRVVVASSNGTLSATTSVTGLVDTTTISTRAWRQKGDDSLGAIIATKGSGTVTSVATGYGLSGGTITTTGTLLVDTLNIATRAWRQKGLDSLAALEVSGSGTPNYIPKFTAGSTIGNSQIFDNGTNVGIGTTSPSTLVHVQKNQNAVTTLRVENTDTTSSGARANISVKNADVDYHITSIGKTGAGINAAFAGTNSNHTLYLMTNGTARQTIFANGRVGINTTTDAGYQLDVNGTLRSVNGANFATSSGNLGVGTASPSAKLHIEATASSTTDATYLYLGNVNGENVGHIDFSNVFGNLARITGTKEGSAGAANEGIISFSTAVNSSLSERMRITSSGELLINTTSDAGDYKLQVAGNIYNTGSAVLAATSGEAYIGTTSDAGNYKLQVSGQAFIRNTATSGALYLDSTSLSIYEVKNRHAILISGHSLTGAEIQGPIYVGTNWNTSSDVSAIEVALTNTASGANSNLMKLSDGTNTFRVTKDAGIFTAAPSGGTARKWKLGSVVASTVILDTANYVEVEINGVAYKLALATPN